MALMEIHEFSSNVPFHLFIFGHDFYKLVFFQAPTATDASCDSVVTTPQHSVRDANNPAG